jgi:iron(III) transport system ATP-binding protein
MTFLTLQGVSKHYGTLAALADIDIAVPPGSRTVIVGPSGSGKTTLLRVIAGFETPDAGRITLGGQTLFGEGQTIPAHRRGIGFMAQEGALFPHLSVGQNVGFGLERHHPKREERIRELMEMVELDPSMRHRRPDELSGGQQQRVALARALAREPKLMLLDEPFSALDTGLREAMRRAVARTLRAAGITTILVTHDQAEALSFADQLAVLRGGRLVQDGTPRALYLQPRDAETALFLGDALILQAEIEGGFARCRLGQVPVDAAKRRGPAQIMLRPEQVRLTPLGPDAAVKDARASMCLGEVTAIEFGGAACTVTVAVADEALVIRATSIDLPAMGSQVRLSVLGTAHVFEPNDPSGTR